VIGTLITATMIGLSVAPGWAAEGHRAEAAEPATGAPAAGRWVDGDYAAAAGTRHYRLWVPGSYDPSRRHMLFVLLHGCTQDAADLARGSRIAEHAERGGFLVLLPEQPETANPKKCWSWFDTAHQKRDAGEPAIIAGMTEQIMKDYAVDASRVHLGGISAGAAMASLVAVAYPERFASLALHSGLAWRGATDVMSALTLMSKGAPDADVLGAAAVEAMAARARAVPTLVIHGANDAVVNPANGRQAARQWAVTNARALRLDSLKADETKGESGGYAWTRACHRAAGGECMVEELIVHGLGHAWSGGSREGTFTDERGPDATAEMVRFLGEHPMKPAR
jgi:poly(hydroxyalkanoate) depolymerase family esterase